MFTDVLGTLCTIATTAANIINTFDSDTKDDKPKVEVVDQRPIIQQAPPQNIPPVTLNLTINVYKDRDGEPIAISKTSNGLALDLK